mmetsp:Transcript_20007/g.47295  ORF Transcript_20007/g.47295 Transcript_20007/m.47295 type:complete len:217 (+) Transcript_20007:51-701(+)
MTVTSAPALGSMTRGAVASPSRTTPIYAGRLNVCHRASASALSPSPSRSSPTSPRSASTTPVSLRFGAWRSDSARSAAQELISPSRASWPAPRFPASASLVPPRVPSLSRMAPELAVKKSASRFFAITNSSTTRTLGLMEEQLGWAPEPRSMSEIRISRATRQLGWEAPSAEMLRSSRFSTAVSRQTQPSSVVQSPRISPKLSLFWVGVTLTPTTR